MYTKRHVVIKNLFDPKCVQTVRRAHAHTQRPSSEVDPTDLDFYTELAADVRSELSKLGEIETLHVFEVRLVRGARSS